MLDDLYKCLYINALFLCSVIVHMENNLDEDDPYEDVTNNAIENSMCICIFCVCSIHTHDRNLLYQINTIIYLLFVQNIPFLLADAEVPKNIPDGTEHKPIDDERPG